MNEKQTYRTANDVPTERAVLEREYLAMPSKTRIALRKSQDALRGLTFRDRKITDALEAIRQALDEGAA